MISDELGQALHDRSTRGELLSDEEQAQLEHWYASQDNIERAILATGAEEETTANLQSQIEATLTQLTNTTQRIQEIASENETLRQEINGLRQQLVDSSSIQQPL